VFSDSLKTRDGQPIRLMFRNNRISTHDVNRGAIPFKDQVLAFNHDHMLQLVRRVLGSSQFEVAGLLPSSTVIPAENLELIMLENVLRLYNAESSTSTSLYQHWLAAKEQGLEVLNYAGHQLQVNELIPNGVLPYLLDTPSTKAKVDKTTDAQSLIADGVCTQEQYNQIRNSSLMAFGIVSQYLQERGMVKEKDQQFTEEQANEIAVRYIMGLQHLTGVDFAPDLRPRDERIVESTNLILDSLL
jgi:phosphoribosylaminoimidazole-succinocarboxamide synthase